MNPPHRESPAQTIRHLVVHQLPERVEASQPDDIVFRPNLRGILEFGEPGEGFFLDNVDVNTAARAISAMATRIASRRSGAP